MTKESILFSKIGKQVSSDLNPTKDPVPSGKDVLFWVEDGARK